MSKIYKRVRPLKEPLTEKQLAKADEIDVPIRVDISDLISCGGIDGLNDLMDERVMNINGCIADIRYTVAGCANGNPKNGLDGDVVIRVQAIIERF